jgi:putative membrane protein
MKHAMMVGTVVLAMSAGSAWAQQTPPANPQSGAAHQHESSTKASMKAGSDEHFVMEAAKGGMAEVELGKLAADKATKDDVKKFGQRMADDHGKANDELKSLAQRKNITLPTAIDPQHKATVDRLSKLSGDAFDRAYMQEMLRDHRKDVAEFKTESRSGKDPDVKAWASKTLPTLEEHLKLAQDTNKAVGTSGTMTKSKKSGGTKSRK